MNSSSVTQRLKDQVPKFPHLKAKCKQTDKKSGTESPIAICVLVKPFSLVFKVKKWIQRLHSIQVEFRPAYCRETDVFS